MGCETRKRVGSTLVLNGHSRFRVCRRRSCGRVPPHAEVARELRSEVVHVEEVDAVGRGNRGDAERESAAVAERPLRALRDAASGGVAGAHIPDCSDRSVGGVGGQLLFVDANRSVGVALYFDSDVASVVGVEDGHVGALTGCPPVRRDVLGLQPRGDLVAMAVDAGGDFTLG